MEDDGYECFFIPKGSVGGGHTLANLILHVGTHVIFHSLSW
jgi:hypothetical protein